MTSSLTIDQQEVEDVVVLRLTGNLNVSESRDLQDCLTQLMDAGHTHIVVGLENIMFIDSTGLGKLVAAHHRAQREGGRILFAGPSAQILQILQVTKLAERLFLRERTEVALEEMLRERSAGG